jgi:F0F1-type ATP synthase membrane subunit c/vacuolar-type H+-ATPase subunit K
VRAAMLLGLVFVETLTLFTFVVGILLYLKL